jgi:hypothetical protein
MTWLGIGRHVGEINSRRIMSPGTMYIQYFWINDFSTTGLMGWPSDASGGGVFRRGLVRIGSDLQSEKREATDLCAGLGDLSRTSVLAMKSGEDLDGQAPSFGTELR